MEYKKMILCAARHSHPAIDGLPAIFEGDINPMDFNGMMKIAARKLKGVDALDLYVTGLTPALVATLNVCIINLIPCTLWHYNKDTGGYEPQVVPTTYYTPQLKDGGYL